MDLRLLLNNIFKKYVKLKAIILSLILATSFASLSSANAESPVSIVMEKTSYSYCERLFYTIEVSEITGKPAIIHIRDESGKGSSAIPIEISRLSNPIPSPFAFEREIFQTGKYFVDVEYSGSKVTAEFNIVDSDNICIPEVIRQFVMEWLNGKMPDGYLIDAFQKYADTDIISIPFEINDKNIHSIYIPDWVKNTAYWWIQGIVSDDDLLQMINYLIANDIISISIESGDEI